MTANDVIKRGVEMIEEKSNIPPPSGSGKSRRILLRISSLLALFAALTMLLCACAKNTHLPPANDKPEPPPHDGVFVSSHSTMTFNGDGQSVTIDFSDELAGALGFADGQGEGIYEFLWSHSLWRYDDAEQFRLTVDGESCVLQNMLGSTDENTITLILSLDGEKNELIFERRESE